MPRKASAELVVDASVARASGETQHPVSRACREFLQEMLKVCHKIVMTQEIRQEWNRHRSKFAYVWLSSMTARKKVVRVGSAEKPELRQAIRLLELGEKERGAILKDIHLVEAALAAGQTVVSLDDNARDLLRLIVASIPSVRPVVWVNPVKEDEHAIQWLGKGAIAEKRRQLGFNS